MRDRNITKGNCEHTVSVLCLSHPSLDVSSINAVRDAAVRICECSAWEKACPLSIMLYGMDHQQSFKVINLIVL